MMFFNWKMSQRQKGWQINDSIMSNQYFELYNKINGKKYFQEKKPTTTKKKRKQQFFLSVTYCQLHVITIIFTSQFIDCDCKNVDAFVLVILLSVVVFL